MDAQLSLFPWLPAPVAVAAELEFPELPDWFFDDDKREEPEHEPRVSPQTGFIEE
jgi:hypothetical protein